MKITPALLTILSGTSQMPPSIITDTTPDAPPIEHPSGRIIPPPPYYTEVDLTPEIDAIIAPAYHDVPDALAEVSVSQPERRLADNDGLSLNIVNSIAASVTLFLLMLPLHALLQAFLQAIRGIIKWKANRVSKSQAGLIRPSDFSTLEHQNKLPAGYIYNQLQQHGLLKPKHNAYYTGINSALKSGTSLEGYLVRYDDLDWQIRSQKSDATQTTLELASLGQPDAQLVVLTVQGNQIWDGNQLVVTPNTAIKVQHPETAEFIAFPFSDQYFINARFTDANDQQIHKSALKALLRKLKGGGYITQYNHVVHLNLKACSLESYVHYFASHNKGGVGINSDKRTVDDMLDFLFRRPMGVLEKRVGFLPDAIRGDVMMRLHQASVEAEVALREHRPALFAATPSSSRYTTENPRISPTPIPPVVHSIYQVYAAVHEPVAEVAPTVISPALDAFDQPQVHATTILNQQPAAAVLQPMQETHAMPEPIPIGKPLLTDDDLPNDTKLQGQPAASSDQSPTTKSVAKPKAKPVALSDRSPNTGRITKAKPKAEPIATSDRSPTTRDISERKPKATPKSRIRKATPPVPRIPTYLPEAIIE